MTIDKLKPGMTVYELGSHGVGHTTMRSKATWPVKIVSIDPNKRVVVASWNGNPEKTYSERTWSKWRLERPVLITQGFNQSRLATQTEKAAIKRAGLPRQYSYSRDVVRALLDQEE